MIIQPKPSTNSTLPPKIGVQKNAQHVFTVHFGGRHLKVMSYNVCDLIQIPRSRQEREKAKAVGSIIQRENPDILALQECGPLEVLQHINDKYFNRAYNQVVYSEIHGRHRLAILIKPGIDVEAVISHVGHRLPKGKPVPAGLRTTGFERDFLQANLLIPATKDNQAFALTMFNTHFKAGVDGGGKRLHEAQCASDVITQELSGKHNPAGVKKRILVVGDLNVTPTNPAGRRVLNTLAGLEDKRPDNDLVNLVAQSWPNQVLRSHIAGGQRDHSFANEALAKDVLNTKIVGDFSRVWPWRIASDHLPVVTDIFIPSPVAATQANAFPKLSDLVISHPGSASPRQANPRQDRVKRVSQLRGPARIAKLVAMA